MTQKREPGMVTGQEASVTGWPGGGRASPGCCRQGHHCHHHRGLGSGSAFCQGLASLAAWPAWLRGHPRPPPATVCQAELALGALPIGWQEANPLRPTTAQQGFPEGKHTSQQLRFPANSKSTTFPFSLNVCFVFLGCAFY